MAQDITQVELGAGRMFRDVGGVWVDLGYTIEGTTFNYAATLRDQVLDQTGTEPAYKTLQGETASLEFTLVQKDTLAMQTAFPYSNTYASGDARAYGFGVNPGLKSNSTDIAAKYKFHPINALGTSRTDDLDEKGDDIIFWTATGSGEVNREYSNDAERALNVVLMANRDTSRTTDQLGIIGDEDLITTQVAPTILGTYPSNTDTDIAVTDNIEIAVSQQLLGGVLNGDAELYAANVKIASAVTYADNLSGTAQSATATTIVLEAAQTTLPNDALNGLYIKIVSGTGSGSDLVAITDYVKATLTATVAAWANGTPDNTSVYEIYGGFITINPTASLDASTVYQIVVAHVQAENTLYLADPVLASFTTAA